MGANDWGGRPNSLSVSAETRLMNLQTAWDQVVKTQQSPGSQRVGKAENVWQASPEGLGNHLS